ncbi:MAG: hypothetical protein ABJE66_01470 [Deltaproteobacteria bacterium]
MRRASIWIAGLIALAGCRQVFGIDEPLPDFGLITDARTDGHGRFVDGPAALMPGLAMHVENGVALWTNLHEGPSDPSIVPFDTTNLRH